MRANVTMNKAALRTLSAAQAQAMAMTAQQMLNETTNDGVMPMDTGILQDSTYVDDSKATKGVVSIVNEALYSRRLYFHPEYNFRTDKNANAQGEWWEEWLTGGKKARPKTLFKQFYARIAGRYVQ